MVLKYLRDQRHTGTIAEIARLKFAYPSADHPNLETIVNVPRPEMSVGEASGKPLYPDIVVVRRPGQWLTFMAQVETADSVSDESARERWQPLAPLGDLFIYVPAGCVQEARRLCKKHQIGYRGIRTWRFRPVWGLEITEA